MYDEPQKSTSIPYMKNERRNELEALFLTTIDYELDIKKLESLLLEYNNNLVGQQVSSKPGDDEREKNMLNLLYIECVVEDCIENHLLPPCYVEKLTKDVEYCNKLVSEADDFMRTPINIYKKSDFPVACLKHASSLYAEFKVKFSDIQKTVNEIQQFPNIITKKYAEVVDLNDRNITVGCLEFVNTR